jgi:hypothetical protein
MQSVPHYLDLSRFDAETSLVFYPFFRVFRVFRGGSFCLPESGSGMIDLAVKKTSNGRDFFLDRPAQRRISFFDE